ncbi:hypothetical protein LFLT20_17500 [Limosilactobacillus fermentum]|nr:hypothetical protein LFLT20_17500 [Limosilactobacillus fermentum]
MKLAFIGTGKIVSDALGAVEPVENLERTAIFARPRSKGKAQAFADQYQIPEVYTDYTQLLEESTADTVYIGLINSAHYPYAKQALEYGKNVILEKPFTGFYDQAVELRDLAKEKRRFIFEAVTILHNEVFTEMKKNVAKLGNIKMALCNYSQYSSRYDAYKAGGEVPHAFDPAFYGELCMTSTSTTSTTASAYLANLTTPLTTRTWGQTGSIPRGPWCLAMTALAQFAPGPRIPTARATCPSKGTKVSCTLPASLTSQAS